MVEARKFSRAEVTCGLPDGSSRNDLLREQDIPGASLNGLSLISFMLWSSRGG